MRRQQLRHVRAVPLRQRVPRPGVQLAIQRPQLLDETLVEGHHLVRRHAVLGDLVLEVVLVAQRLYRSVAQVDETHQAVLERRTDFLGGLPDGQAVFSVLASGVALRLVGQFESWAGFVGHNMPPGFTDQR